MDRKVEVQEIVLLRLMSERIPMRRGVVINSNTGQRDED